MNFDETFFLDTEVGSRECQVITSVYSESRKKYYLIYEYIDNKSDEVFVSSYVPDDESGTLNDITDENELAEIADFLKDFEE